MRSTTRSAVEVDVGMSGLSASTTARDATHGVDAAPSRGETGWRWRYPLAAAMLLASVIVLSRLAAPAPTPSDPPLPGWQTIRPPHEVAALAVQGDVVWAGGMEGVARIDRRSGALLDPLPCEPPLTQVRALLVATDSTLWIGHQNGLTRFDGHSCTTLTPADGLPDQRVNALAWDGRGQLWVGTRGGAAVMTDAGWRTYHVADGLLDEMVNALLVDHQGGVWFGSYSAPRGGVSVLRDGRWQHFSVENGLPHNNVTSFFQDRQGAVWVGTGFYDRGGAVRLVPRDDVWRIDRVLTDQDGLAGAKARSIGQDSLGRYWFGSEYSGLAVMDNDRVMAITNQHGLSDNEVKAILPDADGNVWLGTRDGVTRVGAEAVRALSIGK